MPTLSDLFNLDPNVERLSLLPRMRGSLPSDYGVSPEMMGSVMLQDPRVKNRFMPDLVAPKILYDFIRAIKAPGRAARGEVLDEEEALNTALNMFGGGLATSGSVPIGALGMSARTAPAGTVPLREIPRSPLGFYSKVEEATLPLQNKGSGGQFLAQIQKTPGVKPEEIEVLGLDTFLQSKPTVTKQEVQDYITANKPDVQETILGGGADIRAKADIDYSEGRLTRNEYNQILETSGRPSKFSKYTIPGGENYREILLTLPERTRVKSLEEVNDGRAWRGAAPLTQERYDELVARGGLQDYAEGTFKSSHYEQPNILTHLRANDRVIDGKKALFIEEIQSDWHQAGRKKGYGPQTETTVEAYYETKSGQRIPIGFGKTKAEAEASIDVGWKDTVDVKYETIERKVSEGVPDAPFKKSWHELALKRAIQEAVDKGYDKLAFTTGKTQAERYDLSKQVDSINVPMVNADGTRSVRIDPTGGTSIKLMVDQNGIVTGYGSGSNQFTGKALDEVIGKEMADKVMKVEPSLVSGKVVDAGDGTYKVEWDDGTFSGGYNWASAMEVAEKGKSSSVKFSGVDLQVGGEGQKGFYDEILPKALQNLTKKYGTKVTKTTMPGDYTRDANGIPSMRPKQVEVWSMDITPQMREQIASKGQPLFAGSPAFPIANQDPLMQFLGMGEAENDPLMQFLGQK